MNGLPDWSILPILRDIKDFISVFYYITFSQIPRILMVFLMILPIIPMGSSFVGMGLIYFKGRVVCCCGILLLFFFSLLMNSFFLPTKEKSCRTMP